MNIKLIISGLLISACSLSAFAGHNSDYNDHRNINSVSTGHYYDYARVRSVSPIYETIEHRVPRQSNYRHSNDRHQRSATPAILGTIIGAAIGNQLGHHKSNKRVGAVAGGILGASIGSDIGNKHRYQNRPTQYDIEYEERIVGYDVSYRYRGNTYHTTTREHPGKKIKLRLQFEPVASLYN
jgi:uncharacterized protein YcfJ